MVFGGDVAAGPGGNNSLALLLASSRQCGSRIASLEQIDNNIKGNQATLLIP